MNIVVYYLLGSRTHQCCAVLLHLPADTILPTLVLARVVSILCINYSLSKGRASCTVWMSGGVGIAPCGGPACTAVARVVLRAVARGV